MKTGRNPIPVSLRSPYTLGDVVVLTAAVRDLHRDYPGVFRTSVTTGFPEVWENNPLISPKSFGGKVINCGAVELDRKGASGKHYVHAYLDLINRRLGTSAQISEIKGDIRLSEQEKGWHSDIWSLCGRELPFWLIGSGGKFDIPVKWWDHGRYQQVVDAFRGRIQFVQVGAWGNHHPPLDGAVDLRGKTSVRELIHLVHYSQGVLCGVTALMHLAAAVPTEHGGERAAVIVGGAREPASWEAYPGHEYISTEREMPCRHCWKSQVDGRSDSCVSLKEKLPECMDLIGAEEVIGRIEDLEKSGRISFLRRSDLRFARKAEEAARAENSFDRHNVTPANAVAQAERFISEIPKYPDGLFAGRGIVMCAGGVRYFPPAWVCIRMLRQVGCTLPIELWHYGREEIDREMEALLAPHGVRCVDANRVMKRHPMRNPLGWELKAYALLHSAFREVLLLDADNVPVRNPEFLFETPQYRAAGAIFWPDYGDLSPRRAIWKHCGIPFRKEPEFESGQMVVNKEACWRPVNLAWWYNDHSEFFYRHIHGDKDTFHMAWRKLGQDYAMPPYRVFSLEGTMCQHDFDGRRLFQHRNTPKFVLGENRRVAGFIAEDLCLGYLDQLRSSWSQNIQGKRSFIEEDGWRFRRGTVDRDVFGSVVLSNEYLLPRRFSATDTILDVGTHIGSFILACHQRGSRQIHGFEPHPKNFSLARHNTRSLEGVVVRQSAVLDQALAFQLGRFQDFQGIENTGATGVKIVQSAGARSIPINRLLRELGSVALLKLDCEGSEWPILLNGTEWPRVNAVCGEYHLFHDYVRNQFGIGKTLDPELLFETLAGHFAQVVVERPNRGGLGRFWAAREKGFFANAVRHVIAFEKSGA